MMMRVIFIFISCESFSILVLLSSEKSRVWSLSDCQKRVIVNDPCLLNFDYIVRIFLSLSTTVIRTLEKLHLLITQSCCPVSASWPARLETLEVTVAD